MGGPVIQLCVGWEVGPQLAAGCSEPEAHPLRYTQGRLYVIVKPSGHASSARGSDRGMPTAGAGLSQHNTSEALHRFVDKGNSSFAPGCRTTAWDLARRLAFPI